MSSWRDQILREFTPKVARLTLVVEDGTRRLASAVLGPEAGSPRVVVERTFPRPFSFLHAALACENPPPSPARRTLSWVLVVLAAVFGLGFFAIYRSARAVAEYSDRRARFVSSVTHELKTPLTNIRMYAEMLSEGMAVTKEREREYLGVVGAESARLSRLIENVLAFSRLEKKRLPIRMEPGGLSEVFDEVRSILGENLAREGFTLTVENKVTGPVDYDREAMVQIFLNLVENSAKFSRDSPERRITLFARPGKGFVEAGVSDTGPGIEPRDLKRIFREFYRSRRDEAARRGTGIGLALVRRLAEAMGGTVSARNNPGAGCTVSVRLPFGTKK